MMIKNPIDHIQSKLTERELLVANLGYKKLGRWAERLGYGEE